MQVTSVAPPYGASTSSHAAFPDLPYVDCQDPGTAAALREDLGHPGSNAFFWRTAAGAEVDLLIERVERRIALEVKTAGANRPRVVRDLEEAMEDLDADRGWIIDQAPGIDRLGARVARAGFADVIDGTPD